MSQFTFFPNIHWRNLVLNFPESDYHSLPPSSWRVTRKISENSDSYTQEEAKEGEEFPLACARFECENLEDSSNKAILIVYMEIPCEDTECAAEGRYGTPICVRVGFTAHYLLTLNVCKYSPGAIQYMGETQNSRDRHAFMPGGKIYYLVIGKLPGAPLSNGLIRYTEDGRISSEGLFWNLSREERDQIRVAFQNAYLYIQGSFEPLDLTNMGLPLSRQLDPYGPKVLKIWGLAIAPKGEVDYDVPIDCLEQLGWIL
ncbi:hypothetical protein BDV33DRAFT_187910 [Aspergillus novoparasiticus]|uniref:Uncharacterized protein n=1 Tax=Aspergillus novoparasiticus TaxID=986946 RepID=A0A5N6F5Q5_9EURO|nr:hypothetical protein BDV33DRAFT_187910 [Aspergillus novoparasiticus]